MIKDSNSPVLSCAGADPDSGMFLSPIRAVIGVRLAVLSDPNSGADS